MEVCRGSGARGAAGRSDESSPARFDSKFILGNISYFVTCPLPFRCINMKGIFWWGLWFGRKGEGEAVGKEDHAVFQGADMAGSGRERLADEAIIALYWERSEQAISATDEKYGRYCACIARNILNNSEDAKECVNDTWLRTWNAIPPGRPQRLAAFLGKITRNLAINRLEKERAKKRGGGVMEVLVEELGECLPDRRAGVDPAEDFVVRDAINRFLAVLQEENRKLFVRRYWYFSSIRDIAADYGMGESKVKMALLRMRSELRCFLEKEGIEV